MRDETSRLTQEVAEDRLARAQALAIASAREAGGSALAAEVETRLVARLDEIQKSLDLECSARAEQILELQTSQTDSADKQMSRFRQDLTSLRTTTEQLQSQLREAQLASADKDAGGEIIREVTQLLEIECKGRKNDVEDLRQQLGLTEAMFSERVLSGQSQSNVQELDTRVQGLVNALETERVTRRSDSDSFQAKIDDILDVLQSERTLRTAEVEKLRAALAQLALNMQSFLADEGTAEGQKGLATAIASLQRTLNGEDGSEQAASETSVGVTSVSHPGSMDKRAAQAEIEELANKLRAAQLELREELNARVSVAVASFHGDLAAQAAELRGDIAASQAELKGEFAQCKEQGPPASQAAVYESGGLGLQSSAAVAGQLKEVMRFMQIIASGTEHLGEKICEEGQDRRRAEALINARLSVTERCLADLGANQEDFEMLQQEQQRHYQDEVLTMEEQQIPRQTPRNVDGSKQQVNPTCMKSVMNVGLKDSLEQLVSRVNRMLKPDESAGSLRENLANVVPPVEVSAQAPSVNQSRGQSLSRGQSPPPPRGPQNLPAKALGPAAGLLQGQRTGANHVPAPNAGFRRPRSPQPPRSNASGELSKPAQSQAEPRGLAKAACAVRSLQVSQGAAGQSTPKGTSAMGAFAAQVQSRLPVTGQAQANQGRAVPQGHPAYPSFYAQGGQVPSQVNSASMYKR